MAAHLPNGNKLAPGQPNRRGAFCQLTLCWKQGNNDQQANQNERPAHAAILISEV